MAGVRSNVRRLSRLPRMPAPGTKRPVNACDSPASLADRKQQDVNAETELSNLKGRFGKRRDCEAFQSLVHRARDAC